jgi:hypothetical protein
MIKNMFLEIERD